MGTPEVPNKRRRTARTQRNIDEPTSSSDRKIRSRIRKYRERLTPTEAIVSAVLDDLSTFIGFATVSEIRTCSWKAMPTVVAKHHPGALWKLIEICSGISDLLKDCDADQLKEMFPGSNNINLTV